MSTRALAAAATLLAATISLRAGAPPPSAADPWDSGAAARYLDARMDLWWAKAKTLKTGAGDTKCLSCHTALPYVLARPVLRRLQGEAGPTAHEEKIVEVVQQRVAHTATEQPYYDHTDDKKIESRGVEAVLNALVLTQRDTLGRSSRPSAATSAAIARLWEVQRADGAWDWLNFGLEPYEAPDAAFHGATVAALAVGSRPGSGASADGKGPAGVERLRGYLRANLASQRLFNRTWALLASSRLDGVMTAAERDALVRDLEARQRPDGGWSLADLGTWRWNKTDAPFAGPGPTDAALLGQSDGYATGLVVYALRQSGVAVDRPVVAKGQAWLRAQQVPERSGDLAWAPWRAHSLNFDREHGGEKGEPWRRMFMSDLATAFAVLALS